MPIWNDFYLGGGTGLILRFRHRISADFDLFLATNRLSSPERRIIHRLLKKVGKTIVESTREGSFRVTFEDVTLGFFHYDYPLVAPLERFGKVHPAPIDKGVQEKRTSSRLFSKSLDDRCGVKVASLEDIALMKMAAIIGRGSKKDFIDIYFILKNGVSLPKLLQLSRKKFSHVRDVAIQALQALVYFDDAESEPMPRMSLPIEWKEVKSFFIKEITKFGQKTLGIK
jgi:hypothetical protein